MITFSKKSWHYWLVNKFTNYAYRYPNGSNICAYFWKFVAAVIVATLVSTAYASAGTFILLFTLSGPVIWISHLFGFTLLNVNVEKFSFNVDLTVIAIILVIFSIIKIRKIIKNRITQDVQPSLVGEAYKSFKDKFCALVEFE